MTAAALVTGRLLEFAGMLVLFGSSVFYVYGFAAGELERFARRHFWPPFVLPAAAVTGMVGVLIWVMAQTASVSDQASDGFNPVVVWSILTEARFGRTSLLRIILLATCLLLLAAFRFSRAQWLGVAALSGITVASLAWTGHGTKDEGMAGLAHLAGDILHLISAAVWLGALVPLGALVIQAVHSDESGDGRASYDALQRFSAIGIGVVAVLLASGIINSGFLVGLNFGALLNTTYGFALSVKMALFGLMLLLAAHNRYRLTPQLAQSLVENRRGTFDALRDFRASLFLELALALFVLAAVAFLGTLEPPVS